MSDTIHQIRNVILKHSRYGEVILRAQSYSEHYPVLLPAQRALPEQDRILLCSIKKDDVVHAQGAGCSSLSMVYKEPSTTDTMRCQCGNLYYADTTRVFCKNPACTKTRLGRLSYFVRSYFQNKLSREALEGIETDLVFVGITTLEQLFTLDIRYYGIVGNVVVLIRQMTSLIRCHRNVFDETQNSFWLSFLDALGLPHLRIRDFTVILANESIDHQNGDATESAEYFYHILTNPEYLSHITGLPEFMMEDVRRYVHENRLVSLFDILSRVSLSSSDIHSRGFSPMLDFE